MKDDLTLEQLTALVGEASGWGDRAAITFRRDKHIVGVSVGICGSEASVSAGGVDHRQALIALLKNIEMHHHGILRWHKQRCIGVREILEAQNIYYVKSDL